MEEGSTKTYAGTRTILLPSSTAQLLRERKKSALTEWIFPDLLCPEKPVSPGSAYRRLKGLLEEAGLPDLRFHDLRHPYVKHTTKKYNSEKQKTQATKMDLIAWVFRFCIFNYSKRSWTL